MSKEKYQFREKAIRLKLLILKDDLEYYHNKLCSKVVDIESWIDKLRNTRHVFLVLNSVREAMSKTNLEGNQDYIEKSRNLRKRLSFINHFRNKAVGHLDDLLLERAAQWAPALFSVEVKDNEKYQIMESQRVIVESAVNSFLNEEGTQKVFNTEIDLMYPPDFEKFYDYLWNTVTDSISWLSDSLSIVSSQIRYHSEDEIKEMSSIAGQTEFELSKESEFEYSETKLKKAFQNAVQKLDEMGTKKEIIDYIKNELM